MTWFRCPKCTKLFDAGPFRVQTCPSCGYTGPARTDAELQLPDGVVGKPRRFWPVLGLAILTLGVSLFVYYYKAYKEADLQHGREHPGEMFFIGLIPVVGLAFMAAYIIVELNRARGYRRAHNLRPGYAPVVWFTLFAAGAGAVIGGLWALLVLALDLKFNRNDPKQQLQFWIMWVSIVYGGILAGVLAATAPSVPSLRQLWRVVYEEKGESLPDWMRDVDLAQRQETYA